MEPASFTNKNFTITFRTTHPEIEDTSQQNPTTLQQKIDLPARILTPPPLSTPPSSPTKSSPPRKIIVIEDSDCPPKKKLRFSLPEAAPDESPAFQPVPIERSPSPKAQEDFSMSEERKSYLIKNRKEIVENACKPTKQKLRNTPESRNNLLAETNTLFDEIENTENGLLILHCLDKIQKTFVYSVVEVKLIKHVLNLKNNLNVNNSELLDSNLKSFLKTDDIYIKELGNILNRRAKAPIPQQRINQILTKPRPSSNKAGYSPSPAILEKEEPYKPSEKRVAHLIENRRMIIQNAYTEERAKDKGILLFSIEEVQSLFEKIKNTEAGILILNFVYKNNKLKKPSIVAVQLINYALHRKNILNKKDSEVLDKNVMNHLNRKDVNLKALTIILNRRKNKPNPQAHFPRELRQVTENTTRFVTPQKQTAIPSLNYVPRNTVIPPPSYVPQPIVMSPHTFVPRNIFINMFQPTFVPFQTPAKQTSPARSHTINSTDEIAPEDIVLASVIEGGELPDDECISTIIAPEDAELAPLITEDAVMAPVVTEDVQMGPPDDYTRHQKALHADSFKDFEDNVEGWLNDPL